MKAVVPSLAVFMAMTAFSAGSVRAGQVQILVGPRGDSLSFVPQTVMINQGDHVYWEWRSGPHSVTEGLNCNAMNPIFDSGVQTPREEFAWKAGGPGTVSYFSMPDCIHGMTGTIIISAGTNIPTANFRITEISRTSDHANDYIEITNISADSADFGSFQVTDNEIQTRRLINEIGVPAGGSLILRPGNGPDTPTEIYIGLPPLPALGSFALYVPHQDQHVEDPDFMIDFVQWGAAGRPNELTANSAGFWMPGQFLPLIPEDQVYEFCGNPNDHGRGFWRLADPTPGFYFTDCETPVEPTTWSRVKTLGR